MNNTNEVRGFKVFNHDWSCRDKKYTCPGDFKEDIQIEVCGSGMHFCKKAMDCFKYYDFNSNNKIAEVVAYGAVLEMGDKCCTNKLRIVREIEWQELLTIVNTGENCTGLGNTGNRNTGNWNTGHWNTGNCNTGHWNTGSRNTGNWNTGHWNTGNCNTGDCNTGSRNIGSRNIGNRNTGNWNTGSRNTGDWNTGDWNTGSCNTGDWNTGDYNTGDYNTGDYNTGNWNTGNWNTGDWNISNYNTGCFCTEEHKIKLFDKDSDLTFNQWRDSEAYNLLIRCNVYPTKWVSETDMSIAEKEAHPEYKTTGGYLKTNDLKDGYANWWKTLTTDEKEIIKNIPNFNGEKFKKITGIDVTQEAK